MGFELMKGCRKDRWTLWGGGLKGEGSFPHGVISGKCSALTDWEDEQNRRKS